VHRCRLRRAQSREEQNACGARRRAQRSDHRSAFLVVAMNWGAANLSAALRASGRKDSHVNRTFGPPNDTVPRRVNPSHFRSLETTGAGRRRGSVVIRAFRGH
jgi:hypothetical protein